LVYHLKQKEKFFNQLALNRGALRLSMIVSF